MACIASTFTGSVAALKASKVQVRNPSRRTTRAPSPAAICSSAFLATFRDRALPSPRISSVSDPPDPRISSHQAKSVSKVIKADIYPEFGTYPGGGESPIIPFGSEKNAEREVIHGRWAMLGVAGIVAPEVLGGMGIIPADTGLVWFKSGAIPPQGTFDYWADPMTIFWVNMVMMNFAEIKRGQDYWYPGSQGETPLMGWEKGFAGSGNPAYPGGKYFNFAGLGKTDMATMQKKEIKNGRLAMMAFLGCMVQAAVTGEGPFKNICDHIADPFGANMLVNFSNIGGGASPF